MSRPPPPPPPPPLPPPGNRDALPPPGNRDALPPGNRDPLLVVAGLIATTTYQTVLQAPKFKIDVDPTHTKGFLAGYASWMTDFYGRELAYIVFMSSNTFGFLVSVLMIISLTRDLRVGQPVLLSMTLMVQSYYSQAYFLPFQSLEKKFSLKNAELLSVLPLTIPILLLLFHRRLENALQKCVGKLSDLAKESSFTSTSSS